eukprot:TRINITY_DN4754_c0_g1_i2.p1 TRINITY_DN4754_c0_g1~~TRINITY_DN4754_c0_g1_i2.p1  ORF type:complete len:339 (+),score=96.16 TRINITY_DN4754_c0_g1_i2:79-1095(+)
MYAVARGLRRAAPSTAASVLAASRQRGGAAVQQRTGFFAGFRQLYRDKLAVGNFISQHGSPYTFLGVREGAPLNEVQQCYQSRHYRATSDEERTRLTTAYELIARNMYKPGVAKQYGRVKGSRVQQPPQPQQKQQPQQKPQQQQQNPQQQQQRASSSTANQEQQQQQQGARISWFYLAMVLTFLFAGCYAILWLPVRSALRWVGLLSTPAAEGAAVDAPDKLVVRYQIEDVKREAEKLDRDEREIADLLARMAGAAVQKGLAVSLRSSGAEVHRLYLLLRLPWTERLDSYLGQQAEVEDVCRKTRMVTLRMADGFKLKCSAAALQPPAIPVPAVASAA